MFKGSIAPNITFFCADGSLDLEKVAWHMHWMFQKGLDGLFLTGSYGAGPLMTSEERISVFKTAKAITAGYPNKFILAHVGCIDTRSTVELARAAEEIGVDGISAVPPFYYKHSEDLIIQFYREILENVKIPVFAYNNPETSRFTFSLNSIRKLQDLGLAGLKDSPIEVGFLSNVYYDAKVKEKKFQVIIGKSSGWLPYYYMGIRAMIAGMNNWAPEVITALVAATFEGDVERSEKIYLESLELNKKLHFTDSTIVSHMALWARGFDGGNPRKPMLLPPFSDPKYKEIRSVMETSFAKMEIPLQTGKETLS
jgi:4-hydroxy-tetrahydrodipicolinate synthase